MRIQINAQERELALFALDRADKQCDATRKGLERLRLEPMALMALQGHMGILRRSLKDVKRYIYDWSFDDRRAMATALHVYREQLGTLAAGEGKLLVETSATDQKIGDVQDFITRLAGQDTLFTEVEHRHDVVADADAASVPREISPALQALVDRADRIPPDDASEVQVRRALEKLGSELDRTVPQLAEAPFRTLARSALRMAARIMPDFDGTYAGAYLMEEVVYDEANALVLASWIRTQLQAATEQQLPFTEPPPKKLTTEGINDIRRALGKDPLEQERKVLDENTPQSPIDFACRHCGAAVKEPCRSVGQKVIGSGAHAERMKDAGMWGDRSKVEVANALYLDAVLFRVFGRVDDELRVATKKRRTIDLDAKWVQTMMRNGELAHASP